MALARVPAAREPRTFALTDLAWAVPARRAAARALRAARPRAIVYATTTAALLWPEPGAIRFDSPAAANRPGRHGIWQRPVERRRFDAAPLLLPTSAGALAEAPAPHGPAIVVPIPVEASGPATGARDIAAITYGANPHKKGLDRVLAAWRSARRDGETLVVAGVAGRDEDGVRYAGMVAPAEYRALLRRARVFVTAPRWEDYGIAQLEALADGCVLVTNEAPGPYAALPLARSLDARLVGRRAGGRVAGGARRSGAGLRRSGPLRCSRRSRRRRWIASWPSGWCRRCCTAGIEGERECRGAHVGRVRVIAPKPAPRHTRGGLTSHSERNPPRIARGAL